MEIFTTELSRQLLTELLSGFLPAWEMKGILAGEALKLVFLPFNEFSIASCLVSAGWVIFFWNNKGWILSGLSHILHLGEWVLSIFRKAPGL